METVDCIVIGAGVVGLAAARALAQAGREVVIVEAAGAIGTGVSSRNSEVIHAGLYYPTGSLRARLCVRGRQLLYDFCVARGVPHRRCGKLVVATRDDELPKLAAIAERAAANGLVGDDALRRLSRAEALALEPELHCAGALWSPATGIVDSHGLMTALLGDAEHAGAVLALASPFEAAQRQAGRWVLRTGGSEPFEMAARWLVNCASLHAQQLALAMQGFPAAAVPPQFLSRGHYFALTGRAPFSHLIYPTPVDGGLGVHLTLDLAGQAKFGPDVRWLPGATPDSLDYGVDPALAAAFEADVRRYWPGLPAGALQPAYSGVRPRLTGPGATAADFRIDGPAEHGCAGVVQLFGIESPGLTASLAIGELVAAIVQADGAAAPGH
jgi:L-2-hydroxyglutarate oxidase LhgO